VKEGRKAERRKMEEDEKKGRKKHEWGEGS
jgi:hypothetical protein